MVVPARVIAAEEMDDGESVSYDLTVLVAAPRTEPFEVRHRCSKGICAGAAKHVPAELTVLVDPATRTWGIVHNP